MTAANLCREAVGSGFEPQTSEVEGDCVTTGPM